MRQIQTLIYASLLLVCSSSCKTPAPKINKRNNLTPTSAPTNEKKVPNHAASAVLFKDMDSRGSYVEGTLKIGKAFDESDITHYVLYWGKSASEKVPNLVPLAKVDKTGANLKVSIAKDTQIPNTASHLIVLTGNENGEMAKGVSTKIHDLGIPLNAALSLNFHKTEVTESHIQGTLTIDRAMDESDLNAYVIYWGKSTTQKLSPTPLATLKKGEAKLTFDLDMSRPKGAVYFLVFAKNDDGESERSISTPIITDGIPTIDIINAKFQENDPNPNTIGGTITFDKPSDSTEVVIYWHNSGDKSQSAFAETKTGEYNIPQSTQIPEGMTHFLLVSKNKMGESLSGQLIPIIKRLVPKEVGTASISKNDSTNFQSLSAILTLNTPNSSTIQQFHLYWGQSETQKLQDTPFQTYQADTPSIQHSFNETTLAEDASHILIYSANEFGESQTPVAVEIPYNLELRPKSIAKKIEFKDTNYKTQHISGQLSIERADNEKDLTDYVVYWAKGEAKGGFIVKIPKGKTSDPLHIDFESTKIPDDSTGFLVYTSYHGQESIDKATLDGIDDAPKIASLEFTDEYTGLMRLGGELKITPPQLDLNSSKQEIFKNSFKSYEIYLYAPHKNKEAKTENWIRLSSLKNRDNPTISLDQELPKEAISNNEIKFKVTIKDKEDFEGPAFERTFEKKIPHVAYAWLQLGLSKDNPTQITDDVPAVDNYDLRVISTDGSCPEAIIGKNIETMKLRAGNNLSQDFKVTTCQLKISNPNEKIKILVGDQTLTAQPFSSLTSLQIVGDTGCGPECLSRNEFIVVSTRMRNQNNQLVIHQGNYVYQETSDSWANWEEEFFKPAKDLLSEAPWVFVRGNREDCKGAYHGFIRFLDVWDYTAQSQKCKEVSHPFKFERTGGTFYIADSSAVPSHETSSAEQKQGLIDGLSKTFKAIDSDASSSNSKFLLTSSPIWACEPQLVSPSEIWNNGGLRNCIEQGQFLRKELGKFFDTSKNNLRKKILAVISGRLHFFSIASFQDNEAMQWVIGNGGSNPLIGWWNTLGMQIPNLITYNLAITSGDRIVKKSYFYNNDWGFSLLEADHENWTLSNFDTSGAKAGYYQVNSQDRSYK